MGKIIVVPYVSVGRISDKGDDRFFKISANGGRERYNWQVVYITRSIVSGSKVETLFAMTDEQVVIT